MHSAYPFILSQNLSTKEMEEETTDDNGVLVLARAQKEHSGLYECQGLDLETMASLLSGQQELLVNCEGLGLSSRDQAGARGTLPCPAPSRLTLLLCPQMCLISG